MKWKGEHVINIVCEPIEIELKQFVPFLLATPNPYVFSWSDGYLTFFRFQQDMYYDTNKKTAGYLTVVWEIEYIKTKYYNFIKMNGNTGEIEFTDTMKNSVSDNFFYPISDIEDEILIKITKKVKECDHAIKRKQ